MSAVTKPLRPRHVPHVGFGPKRDRMQSPAYTAASLPILHHDSSIRAVRSIRHLPYQPMSCRGWIKGRYGNCNECIRSLANTCPTSDICT